MKFQTENSPSCFPGDKMFMSKKSRAKIDLNFLRPSPCKDKKWKSPLYLGFVVVDLPYCFSCFGVSYDDFFKVPNCGKP